MSLSKNAETPKLPLEIIGKILLNYDDDDDVLEELRKCRLISPRFYKAAKFVNAKMSLSKSSLETPKLPLEIVGKILLNYEDDDQLKELKKCRLISPRFYKGVQDLFQDEFCQKYMSHFDGSNQTFATSRSFGYNIFGFYRLNFATLRISNSELYLLKTFLRRLILDNLQTLELKDNLLNWKEIIQVLGQFKKMVHFKFIESNSDSAKKMYNIYKAEFRLYEQDSWVFETREVSHIHGTSYLKVIKCEVEKYEDFLTSLKTFEVDVTHVALINIMSMIISNSNCELENFLIKININGLIQIDPYYINSFQYFENFSESLRSLEICVDDSKILKKSKNYRQDIASRAKSNFSNKVIYTFYGIVNFKKISSLIIKVPVVHMCFADYLSLFVKNQENLTNLNISTILGDFRYEDDITEFQNCMNGLMIPKNKTRFKYKSFNSGFSPIQNFQENLTSLIVHYNSRNSIDFSDQNCPIFLNCSELKLKFLNPFDEAMPDFQIQGIISKCPNLVKLSFVPKSRPMDQIAQITNEDFQLIIRHYENLQELHLENCIDNLTDSGLTGLAEEAIQIRSDNEDLPVKPEEISGLSISKLKKLKTLVIASHVQLQISDLSAKYGFNGMINLKELQLTNTNITPEGFVILKEKTGSKYLNIL